MLGVGRVQQAVSWVNIRLGLPVSLDHVCAPFHQLLARLVLVHLQQNEQSTEMQY